MISRQLENPQVAPAELDAVKRVASRAQHKRNGMFVAVVSKVKVRLMLPFVD